jgi:hypothetical protein
MNKRMHIKRALRWAAILLAGGMSSCIFNALSGGSGGETGNPVIMGTVLDTLGEPVVDVKATALPSAYVPVGGAAVPDSLTATTDRSGHFTIRLPKRDTYTVQAVNLSDGRKLLIANIVVQKDTTTLPADTLRDPGIVKIALLGGDSAGSFVYIPGTTLFAPVHNGYAVIDGVPAGLIPFIYTADADGVPERMIQSAVAVMPGDTTRATGYGFWAHSGILSLNTTAAGANVAGAVHDFPVLVRLANSNFNFQEAKPDGGDLRFAKVNGSQLPYEIERWDAASSLAEIWVRVDTVFGNDSSQHISMYWGNPGAANVSDGVAVFDTAEGFEGVWHLAGAGGAPATDATANSYDGTPYGTPPAQSVSGVIGSGLRFDGASDFFQMQGTASSRLNFPRNGVYAISAWAYADTIDNQFRTIASKGDFQYNLEVIKEGYWEFAEYGDKTGWEQTTYPAAAKNWVYVVGVRDGSKEYFYFNGQCVDSTIGVLVDSVNVRNTNFDFLVGRIRKTATDTTAYFFKGVIDEVRAESVAPSADRVKLCYMNQRPDDKLIVFHK